ncbi:hypothetical protein DEO72_LG2g3711 [Vigna unguiculata]|uniref:Uncharacterized protein n=1 Tax=Vigna unguiculata TaxID=3917 RepID=A0A4D6L4B5_VIGUN|nr:hypothetical protein DEO72_LG2g3711 [Vigna unguiculata]
MFRSLRNELAGEAKKFREPQVPNLKGALVDVHAPNGRKRNVMVTAQKKVGKEMKKLRPKLFGYSFSVGNKRAEVGLLESRKVGGMLQKELKDDVYDKRLLDEDETEVLKATEDPYDPETTIVGLLVGNDGGLGMETDAANEEEEVANV